MFYNTKYMPYKVKFENLSHCLNANFNSNISNTLIRLYQIIYKNLVLLPTPCYALAYFKSLRMQCTNMSPSPTKLPMHCQHINIFRKFYFLELYGKDLHRFTLNRRMGFKSLLLFLLTF